MRKRKRDPTTLKRATRIEQDKKLQQQFKACQQEYWDTSTRSKNSLNHLQLINKSSPLELESCLQQKRSPSEDYTWRVTNDDVAADVMKERRATIESGRLKGRRLFKDDDDSDEICSECFQESEVSSTCSYYGFENDEMIINEDKENERKNSEDDELVPVSSSSVFEEIIERDRMEAEAEKKETKIKWITVVLLIIVLFIVGIISMRSNGGCFDKDQVSFLVPT